LADCYVSIVLVVSFEERAVVAEKTKTVCQWDISENEVTPQGIE